MGNPSHKVPYVKPHLAFLYHRIIDHSVNLPAGVPLLKQLCTPGDTSDTVTVSIRVQQLRGFLPGLAVPAWVITKAQRELHDKFIPSASKITFQLIPWPWD